MVCTGQQYDLLFMLKAESCLIAAFKSQGIQMQQSYKLGLIK